MTKPPRVIIASNRLPIVLETRGGDCAPAPAAGGLATGLRGFHERGDSVWIGSDSSAAVGGCRDRWQSELRRRRIVPVTLEHATWTRYYDGVCNGVLWPSLHYDTQRIPWEAVDWSAYRTVNERFAAAIAAEYRRGDIVWIHDYHLLLVPRLVRNLLPDAPIAFFLHVPFPAADVFRALPWRREILDGILGATVVGFHTETYAAHFLDAVRAMTARGQRSGAALAGHTAAHVGVYPMGVDAPSFAALASNADVDRECSLLRSGHHRLLLGVDRLDYTKGIPRRLLAYDHLLRDDPSLRGRVRLIQVAVPSRENVPAYQQLRREIDELVGRINGEHGTPDWTPIQYVHQSITPAQLVALYRAADVMLVTPLRDGMNLVAKEFVASRVDGDGVLLLSEFAGAADQMTEAVLVNPYSIAELAGTIRAALTMNESERRRRMAALRADVIADDVDSWAAECLSDVVRASARVHYADRSAASRPAVA